MIRPILRYGEGPLHTRAAPVERFDDEFHALLRDMAETMYAAPGIGLAAPQIGVSLRVFIIDLRVAKEPGALIEVANPSFVACDGIQIEEEGCLSLPGFNATVARPARAIVRGQDRDGEPVTIEGTGLLARALQHEMDHLDGALFIERLRGIRRQLILRRLRKMRRSGRW